MSAGDNSSTGLTDSMKAAIQGSYTRWLDSHGFKPRYGQRLMIATVAKTLARADAESDDPERFGIIEAGTGIGKTVAYTLAAAHIAQEKNKTLIISTATVALQEQLINKDLPDLVESADLPLSFALAKGRGRYLCLSKLDGILRNTDQQGPLPGLYPDENIDDTDSLPHALYQSMSEAVLRGEWSGDRDEWPEAVEDKSWRLLTSDRAQCHNRRCTWVSDCCFFKARDTLQEADCIVTNHDLVLSDLALGGGAILPDPEDCLFIFDEAHHLADKAVQHFSSSIRLNGSVRWLQQMSKTLDAVEKQWDGIRTVRSSVAQIRELCNLLLIQFQPLPELLHEYYESMEDDRQSWRRSQHARFDLGAVPEALLQLGGECAEQFANLAHHLSAVASEMQKVLEAEPGSAELEQWFPVFGAGANRANSAQQLFLYYHQANKELEIPRAFWLTKTEFDAGVDFGLHSAPLLASNYLDDLLWSRCAAATLTSATLSALGSFDRLQSQAGLPADAVYQIVPSPFDYARNAVLKVPELASNPSDVELHTDNVRRYIEQLDEDRGVLVLFMSRRQMQDVHEAMDVALREVVLLQDQRSKKGLIDEHKRRVDLGERSIIFGLASFAEGVDLPGDYCRHVVIAKLPFAVPDEPVASALAEWVESQGKNSFVELSVPDAALRLVQACGRLLRNETDTGVVSLLDRRIVEKRYGQQILDSLPPFRREISS